MCLFQLLWEVILSVGSLLCLIPTLFLAAAAALLSLPKPDFLPSANLALLDPIKCRNKPENFTTLFPTERYSPKSDRSEGKSPCHPPPPPQEVLLYMPPTQSPAGPSSMPPPPPPVSPRRLPKPPYPLIFRRERRGLGSYKCFLFHHQNTQIHEMSNANSQSFSQKKHSFASSLSLTHSCIIFLLLFLLRPSIIVVPPFPRYDSSSSSFLLPLYRHRLRRHLKAIMLRTGKRERGLSMKKGPST